VATNPPAGAGLATTVVRRFVVLQLQHHDKASLLAGKLHAILQRSYTKGRDIYDLLWYLSDPTWPPPNLVLLNNALAQAHIAGYRLYGEPDLAPLLGFLGEQFRQAEAANRDDRMNYMLVLEALARQAIGQMDQAMNLLERALALAATHGFAMTFLCHGAPMEALLQEAVRRRISPAYAGRLLAASGRGTSAGIHAGALPSPTSLPEPLSKRELEVLRLLTSSLTGPQIADELFISLGTFQTHTKSIYGKLGVHNRIGAIERARELKLV
jgi:LuxR family maltose regulon positive regulatory protein